VVEEFSDEFRDGMAGDPNRSRRLGDVGPDSPAHWYWGRSEPDAHLLLMLFAKKGRLDTFEQQVMSPAWSAAFELAHRLETCVSLILAVDKVDGDASGGRERGNGGFVPCQVGIRGAWSHPGDGCAREVGANIGRDNDGASGSGVCCWGRILGERRRRAAHDAQHWNQGSGSRRALQKLPPVDTATHVVSQKLDRLLVSIIGFGHEYLLAENENAIEIRLGASRPRMPHSCQNVATRRLSVHAFLRHGQAYCLVVTATQNCVKFRQVVVLIA